MQHTLAYFASHVDPVSGGGGGGLLAALPCFTQREKNYHEPFESTGAFFYPQRLFFACIFSSMATALVLFLLYQLFQVIQLVALVIVQELLSFTPLTVLIANLTTGIVIGGLTVRRYSLCGGGVLCCL